VRQLETDRNLINDQACVLGVVGRVMTPPIRLRQSDSTCSLRQPDSANPTPPTRSANSLRQLAPPTRSANSLRQSDSANPTPPARSASPLRQPAPLTPLRQSDSACSLRQPAPPFRERQLETDRNLINDQACVLGVVGRVMTPPTRSATSTPPIRIRQLALPARSAIQRAPT
jgi:hypothetical protein